MNTSTDTGPVPGNAPFTIPPDEALDLAEYFKDEGDAPPPDAVRKGFAALTIGAVGVVYGDIGTSPIYAFREALKAVSDDGVSQPEVLGLLSLLIWTLIIIVTIKYVFALLRADNRGEGGILALYTLVRLALGRRSVPVLLLAILGAALFAGDAIITPAISVLSAVEGAGLIVPALTEWVMPATLVILIVLFLVQSKGTGILSVAFGPITAIWFLTLAGLGIWHIAGNPAVLLAFNPYYGVAFIVQHIGIAFIVLGAVFLAVTGAEALYADLGHFGRKPIMVAWFALVFPALILCYLGQGALVLTDPAAISDPFFRLAPDAFLPFLVILATAATVIASQAVISGAYSMARAAVQLGLLPRMIIRHTAQDQHGQIYLPSVNWFLLIGVVWLVLAFQTSGSLASAYGIAVTGTMVITTILALIYLVASGKLSRGMAVLLVAPVALLELAFLASNASKIADGGYVPVLLALALTLIMWAWWQGTQTMLARGSRLAVRTDGFVASMDGSSVHIVPGTAFFLTPDPDVVPSSLLHNLRHNRVLHDQNVLLTVETMRVPYATPDERASFAQIGPHFAKLTLRFGFMESPNVSRAMGHARQAGLRFDVMASSFFLSHRRPVVTGGSGLDRVLDRIYALLARLAADPTSYYHLPRNLVVELGERVAV